MVSRLSSIKRLCPLEFDDAQALILFGPRKTGKTSLLQQAFPHAKRYDLLMTDVRARYALKPSLLREETLQQKPPLVILDEVQKVPELLDEVHWLLENTATRFILCGSSPRKLKRGAANLLGGRALRIDLFPLVSAELDDFDLTQALNSGLLPQHFLSPHPDRFLRSYVEQYLHEEIIEESHIRKLQSFHKFLEVAGLTHGELLNYANVATDCGVSAKTVREYYQILEDTLLGFTLAPWAKVKTRRLIQTSKFYLFDTGILRHLRGIDRVTPRTTEFGHLFETFILQEIRAYLNYHHSNLKLAFWRTTSNFEVDVIIGNMQIALEIKSTDELRQDDLRGLRALSEEFSPEKRLVVSREKTARQTEDGIQCLPYREFLRQLWTGALGI